MCDQCLGIGMKRRAFLGLAGMAAAAAGLGLAPRPAAAAPTGLTADQALAKLKDGNARFLAQPQVCAADLSGQRSSVAGGQAPWATVLSCADSRVPPELLFGGLGLGELFVCRNAGNMIDTDVLGTMEYGAEHLGSPLIVVMGHQRCGAVAAACDVVTKKAKLPGSIGPMVEPILPAVKAAQKAGATDLVDATVHESARRTAAKIPGRSKILSHLVHEGKVKIVAAYYALDTGKVEFLA
ncbi:carbonic anhydrase [Siculibacillus lacustris]|uniref:carbonic anhydrase n=1 Tax=Siculibacillus lacustris TaxID=1549641 RepID=A0A4Q9VY93_9HYPH|nr:carbonic anhydrase [Siculibacillus lacustris]TBW40962.1 carbonic anhydrase [Siculibacillus lacustris]